MKSFRIIKCIQNSPSHLEEWILATSTADTLLSDTNIRPNTQIDGAEGTFKSWPVLSHSHPVAICILISILSGSSAIPDIWTPFSSTWMHEERTSFTVGNWRRLHGLITEDKLSQKQQNPNLLKFSTLAIQPSITLTHWSTVWHTR